MKRRPIPRLLLLACALLAAVMLPASAASAAEIRQGDNVTVASGETVRDDVYAFGNTVTVSGVVEGDVVAFASSVSIEGTVTGDVITGASDVQIGGDVGGSVRAGSGQIEISGTVGEDLLAGAGRTSVGSGGSVGRDIITGSGDVRVDGSVGRNILASAGALTISSDVGGNVTAAAGSLTVPPGASIGGDLVYDNDTDANVDDGAVAGSVSERDFDPESGKRREANPAALFVFALLAWLRGLVGMALLALLVALPFRRYTRASADQIRHRPLPSLGIGAALLFGVPVVSVFALVIGILVGGWWIALGVWALYVIALVVAIVLAAAFLGGWLLGLAGKHDAHPLWASLLGLLALWVVLIVPILGGLAMFAAVLFGLGAGAIALWETAKGMRGPEPASMAAAAKPPAGPAGPAGPATPPSGMPPNDTPPGGDT